MQLISLNQGAARSWHWRGRDVRSGIFKTPVDGPLPVSETGLAQDEQVDTQNHGGPDKALRALPASTYALFHLEGPWGALGENLTLPAALNEEVVRLGDRLRIGEVLLEVTQPRSPCWKLDALAKERFGEAQFLQRYAASGQVGYYLRVLTPGNLEAGQPIAHEPTSHPAPTIQALFLAKHHGGKTAEQCAIIEQALAHPALSQAWREELTRLISQT